MAHEIFENSRISVNLSTPAWHGIERLPALDQLGMLGAFQALIRDIREHPEMYTDLELTLDDYEDNEE